MTDKQIEEGNLIILEFVQKFKTTDTRNYWIGCGESSPLYFHESWSWLIPAVEIVEKVSKCILFSITNTRAHIMFKGTFVEAKIEGDEDFYDGINKSYYYSSDHPKKECVWLALIESIIYLNEKIND